MSYHCILNVKHHSRPCSPSPSAPPLPSFSPPTLHKTPSPIHTLHHHPFLTIPKPMLTTPQLTPTPCHPTEKPNLA